MFILPNTSGKLIYHQFKFQSLYAPSTLYLCVLHLSQKQQRIFPCATLTDGYCNRDLTIYSPVVIICIASYTLKKSTFCQHSVFMCLFRSEIKQPLFQYRTLSDCYFNKNLNFYTSVVTISTTSLTMSNTTFCPQCVFLCFVRI